MDPAFHLLIPVFILLMLGFDKKLVVFLSPFVFLPDVEYLSSLHRYLGHNIFVVILVVGLCWLISRNYKKLKWQFTFIPGIYLISHIILDLNHGVAILYPIIQDKYYFSIPYFVSQVLFVGLLYVLLLRNI